MSDDATVYVGPGHVELRLRSYTDLQHLLKEGLTEEGHHLDFKLQPDPGKGGNKEAARDMASFAIDGGTLIYGIRDGKGQGPDIVEGCDLAGLPEKLGDIARNLIDPPLAIETTVLPDTARAGIG